jgi:hypothetical protein
MSSKRGRKRDDNLPPNLARNNQRAFRARRAAHLEVLMRISWVSSFFLLGHHLQALQQRISEVEEENSRLRQALNLPPASRLPMGRGPTGRDKPKSPVTAVL